MSIAASILAALGVGLVATANGAAGMPTSVTAAGAAKASRPATAPIDWAAARERTLRERKENYVERAGGLDIEMVWIPGGSFEMGSEAGPGELTRRLGLGSLNSPNLVETLEEQPLHPVVLDGYWLGRTEVTVGQFRRFVESTGWKTVAESHGGSRGRYSASPLDRGASWEHTPYEQTDNFPATCLTWLDARAFLDWLSRESGRLYCLPTEAQWEYACRAGGRGLWPFGDDSRDLALHAWFESNSKRSSHPVGKMAPNAWGLCDMLGNAAEMCFDLHGAGYYAISMRGNPLGPDFPVPVARAGGGAVGVVPTAMSAPASAYGYGAVVAFIGAGGMPPLVVRGGSYSDSAPRLRSASRAHASLDETAFQIGFRVCSPLLGSSRTWKTWQAQRAARDSFAQANEGRIRSGLFSNAPHYGGMMSGRGATRVLQGRPAPDFASRTIQGDAFRLSELKSKVVLLHFWSPDSYSATRQIPLISELNDALTSRGLCALSVSVEPFLFAPAVALAERYKIGWPMLPNGEAPARDGAVSSGDSAGIAQNFGFSSFPFLVLIGKDGKVKAINPSEERMGGMIADLLLQPDSGTDPIGGDPRSAKERAGKERNVSR